MICSRYLVLCWFHSFVVINFIMVSTSRITFKCRRTTTWQKNIEFISFNLQVAIYLELFFSTYQNFPSTTKRTEIYRSLMLDMQRAVSDSRCVWRPFSFVLRYVQDVTITNLVIIDLFYQFSGGFRNTIHHDRSTDAGCRNQWVTNSSRN